MLMETTDILQSVRDHVDTLRDFLTPEQRRRFLEFWQPIANAGDMPAFETAINSFRVRFCGRMTGLAKILPELNTPVAVLGHPSVIAPYPSEDAPSGSDAALPFENMLVIAKEVLRRFEQKPPDASDSNHPDDIPQDSR